MKENIDLIGKLCFFGKEIVLVVDRYQNNSCDVLFSIGCVDRVSIKKIIPIK